jgi:hypothetical protein
LNLVRAAIDYTSQQRLDSAWRKAFGRCEEAVNQTIKCALTCASLPGRETRQSIPRMNARIKSKHDSE